MLATAITWYLLPSLRIPRYKLPECNLCLKYISHGTPHRVRSHKDFPKRLTTLSGQISNMDMDNMLAGGMGGGVGQFPLEQWFYEMPVCTRWWTTATVATSILVQCQIITPFQLFYSFRAVFIKNQVQLPPTPNLIMK